MPAVRGFPEVGDDVGAKASWRQLGRGCPGSTRPQLVPPRRGSKAGGALGVCAVGRGGGLCTDVVQPGVWAVLRSGRHSSGRPVPGVGLAGAIGCHCSQRPGARVSVPSLVGATLSPYHPQQPWRWRALGSAAFPCPVARQHRGRQGGLCRRARAWSTNLPTGATLAAHPRPTH